MASNRLAKVVITLDGSRVEVGLDKIRQKTQEVVAKMQTLANAGKQNTKEYKECVKALNTLHKAETDVASVQQRINTYMKELGNVATTDLRRAYREGIQLREGFKGTDKELQKLNHDLAAMKAQIDKNTGSTTALTKAQMGFVGSLKTTLKNLVAYAGVFALFNQIKGAIISIGKKNLEFSDELTNIRKVSQLAEEDINKLANSLAKIDTRSSVHELNNLAYAGAKLGMQEHGGVAALESFVKAADKVNVALKEDLGDDALVAMSKLVEVMGLIPKMGIEKSMDAAGSAIFTLSTSSTATGANIIEFSKRLMGLANVSHVTTAELLALGSASDAMGLMPEVSSTAFNKVFTNIQSNTAAIEKSLDFTKGTLQELINDGKTMEAMTAVFTKMHGMSMAELKGRGVFQALGSDGARLNNVMTTMADRVDMLTQHLEMSNKAFEEGTAVQKEYEMQMESAQGYMERSANLWEKALVNPEGVDAMKEFAKAWYNLSQTLSTSTLYMGQIKLTLKGLITAMEAIITLAPFLIDFFMLKGVVQGIKYLNSMRLAFLANKAAIEGMTEAQLAANKAMKANVYIAIAAAVITLGQYIYELSVKTDDAEKAQERLNGALSEGAVEAQREVGHLNNVIKALDSAKLSQEGREKVIADFNQKYGQYINALGIEIKTVDDLRKNYDALAGAIRRAAYERVRDKFKEQELEPLIKASIEAGADLQKGGNAQTNAISVHDAEQAVSNFSKAIQTLTAKNLKKFRETYKQELQAIGLNPQKATVDQIKAKSTPADTRKIFNQSVQNGPRSLNEYLMNLIDKGEIKSAADAYKNIIMKEFSEGAKFGAEFDENLNYVVGQRVVNGVKVGTPVTKGTGAVGGEKSSAFNKKLYENVEKFVDAYLAVKNRGDEIDSAFAPYIRVPEPQGDNKIKPYEGGGEGDKGGSGNTGKSKELREEFKDAKEAATGIISKLEEYYRLQEAAIQEARADGQLTEDQAKEMVRALSIVKNESLATARRAVTTGNTDAWDEMKTKVLPSVLADTSDVSQNLLSTIQQVAVDKLHTDLQKFNGGKDVMGLDSRAFFDQMNAKAAGNTREAARLRAAITNEVEKALKQYHFVELAQDKMRKDLETMGFMTETYEQWAKRMQEGIKEKPDTQLPNGGTISDKDAYNKMGQKFVVQRDIAYRINIENEREALDWLQQFSKDAEGNMEDWTYAFPELQRWLDLIKTRDESLRKDDIVGARQAEKAIEESMPAIQQFYGNLMQYEGAYYDALKKRDDLQNKRLDSWWEHSDQKKENDRKLRDIQIYDFQYNTMHEGQGMGYMMGLTNDVSQDPEVLREQAVLEQKIAIWKKAKEEREANLISEEVYQQKLRDMQDQTMTYSQKVMDNINKRISRIQAFVKPVETAANTIGKKLGDMIFNMQSEESTWEQIWKNMALAMAESLLTMVGQYAQYQIQKSAINKSEVLDEAGKAQAITMLNISSGAAKTIGTLGWWGIALIPVITGLLMGLLTSALSTVNSSESGTSTSTPKTKLVSGMLTYDKGNVDRFAGRRLLYDDGTTQVYGRRRYIGQDGRVYTATAEPAPKDGLVTHPIATTVQGQPALVAERGPEIVIGRETTKAIMMNEPQLIKYLADYGKTGGFAGGYPAARGLAAFDSGNINGQWSMVNGQSSMVNGQLSMVNGQLSPDDARALVAAITTFNQTVQQMQQKGIPCYINKYGRGGLIDEVKSGMKFMSKYEG